MHLSDEALARLANEPATDDERAHLERCATCREATDAYRRQLTSLARLRGDARPAAWSAIEARLRAEGLIIDQPRVPVVVRPRALWRIAAALACLAIGLGAGVAIGTRIPGTSSTSPSSASTQADTADVIRSLQRAEAAYRAALARVSGVPTSDNAATRLAVLQAIVLTTDAALRQAPADPLINIYHLAALDQRDALLATASANRGPTKGEPWF